MTEPLEALLNAAMRCRYAGNKAISVDYVIAQLMAHKEQADSETLEGAVEPSSKQAG